MVCSVHVYMQVFIMATLITPKVQSHVRHSIHQHLSVSTRQLMQILLSAAGVHLYFGINGLLPILRVNFHCICTIYSCDYSWKLH